MKSLKYIPVMIAAIGLAISGISSVQAHCGECGKEDKAKKECPADCKKECCKGKKDKESCKDKKECEKKEHKSE